MTPAGGEQQRRSLPWRNAWTLALDPSLLWSSGLEGQSKRKTLQHICVFYPSHTHISAPQWFGLPLT